MGLKEEILMGSDSSFQVLLDFEEEMCLEKEKGFIGLLFSFLGIAVFCGNIWVRKSGNKFVAFLRILNMSFYKQEFMLNFENMHMICNFCKR